MNDRRPRPHALIPAAGRGERFGGAVPKQFLLLHERPVLRWTVERLLAGGVASLTVGLAEEWLARGEELLAGTPARVVVGGASRQETVERCLSACPAGADELVAVHDGARPAVHAEDVAAVAREASRTGAAILGRPEADTLKRLGEGGAVEATVDRAHIFRAETPQVFRRALLEAALAAARRDAFVGTDEASLVERLGEAWVSAVAARHANPKLTDVADLVTVVAILAAEGAARRWSAADASGPRGVPLFSVGMEIRVGQGYDVHPLVEGRRLVLGGETIDHPRGLAGFSDGDALLHALGDALLGAAGLGDLGEHFPPGDDRWRDADSLDLLGRIVERVAAEGWTVANCDLTVIAEAPRLAPHRASIRRRIAGALGVGEEAVGLKATTHEKLGSLGRGEGIAALAVVLLTRGRG